MAFKGAWHRGDGGGGGSGASNDRRYVSSTDSFSSFGLPPQGVQGNQMGLTQMNYQTNPNNIYSVMNTNSSVMGSANYSSSSKSLPYTGTVSNIFRDSGVIDNEIFFKLTSISGPTPRVGDRVVCQMKQADSFGSQTPYKYYGYDVRCIQTPTDVRRPSRPTGGPQQMSRNTDSYMNRNQNNRNQPSNNAKRPLPATNNNNNLDHQHHHPQPIHNNNNTNLIRDRQRPQNNMKVNERRRESPVRRSSSRTNKVVTPKRTSRAPPPKYTCTLPKASLDYSDLNVTQIHSRYARLHIPSDFFHASYTWHQSIPLDRPLKFVTPCSFHIFNKNLSHIFNKNESLIDPSDIDYTWNVRVMLTSSPDIQTLISRSCLINNEHGKSSTINPDDLEHPTKLIKFLVGVRYQNEYFPIGGPWSPSLDGDNPESDPQVLIRTAIRCVKAQTGIDLKKCVQWCRYLEVRYHRPEEIHKGRLIESRVENIVVFLPDIAGSCMPTSLDWEETMAMYKQACSEEIAEELNEINTSDHDMEAFKPSHHSKIDVENLRTIDLRAELKARGEPITGLKVDLKKRLAKIIQQEKLDEEKIATSTSNNDEQKLQQETTTNATKTEIKESTQADIDRIRKDIEAKYQVPSHRCIPVHPTTAKADKFDCRIVSLHYLLNYANKDTIKEKCFELYLFAEAFNEMLMRDYSYKIYRSLYSCLEIKDVNINVEAPTDERRTDNQEQNDNKDEQIESMVTNNDETAVLPGLDLNAEEADKKRKRTPSQEDASPQRKKLTQEESIQNSPNDDHKSALTIAHTYQRTIHPELLLAFTFYDRNRCGYLAEKDLEDILLLSGLSLTKNEVKILVSRIAQHDKVQYHQLTDKAVPIEDPDNNDFAEIDETDIDPLAPKGNLPNLPSHLSIFGIRPSTTSSGNQPMTSVDDQQAMKQLEMSIKIQTGLELKIDTLKAEVQKLTEELHASQKSDRSHIDQLNETKKRLRDTQHDLKELEDKYKRYSDALYRVRSESRSTFDHLTHVLGIKEKQPSQGRKPEDETKKATTIKTDVKSSSEGDKPKQTEIPVEQEQTVKPEENPPPEITDVEQ